VRFPAPRETEGREKAGVSLSIFIDTGRNPGNQFLEKPGSREKRYLKSGDYSLFW